MQMESSRRSALDRSRELPNQKKPRISEDASDRDRAPNGVFSRVSSVSQTLNPRLRANEREREERDDSTRGGGSGGNPSSSSSSMSYQQQQELVAQYKTALSELTFNSKPIITNLTIIAGENLHAAKGIAATICNNVLEVPSEQKLPSLYLLDSIVKNIGRDYIKCFAARLPEVFCKAYKQVDPSIHPGMRHLFGTWKGVFPPAPLQLIEKELGFLPTVNGSSGTTGSRSDSQAQRPAHSIHVNPKYLERQRLQQSTRAKETSSDSGDDVVAPVDDSERSDRAAIVGNTRQLTNLSTKIPNIQHPRRELLNDPTYEKKGLRDVKDHEFSPVRPRKPDLGVGRINDRITERLEQDKSYYDADSRASETAISRRDGLDADRTHGKYRVSAFAQADRQLPNIHLNNNNANKSIHSTPKNWKNSEEEEYMWDDVNSNLSDYGGCNRAAKNGWDNDDADKPGLQRGQWIPLETEKPDFHRDKLDTFRRTKASAGEERVPLFQDIGERHLQTHNQLDADPRRHAEQFADPLGRAASGHHALSLWPNREPLPLATSLNQTNSRNSGQLEDRAMPPGPGSSTNSIPPFPRAGPVSHSLHSSIGPSANINPGSSGMYGHQRQQPLRPPSPAHLPPLFQPLQRQKLQNAFDHDHPLPPLSQVQIPGHFNTAPHASVAQDSPSSAQNQTLQTHTSHSLQLPASFGQLRHPPFPLRDFALQQAPTQISVDRPSTLSQNSGTSRSLGFQGDTQPTQPIDVSGQSSIGSLLADIIKSGILPGNPSSGLQNFSIQPPVPSGPPPIQSFASSAPLVTPPLPIQASQGNNPSGLTAPLAGTVLPPLPPGPPPPSSLVTTSSQKSNTGSIAVNPFSSLLSSLVAKGLISSTASELPAITSAPIPNKIPEQSMGFSSSMPVMVPSTTDTSTIPPSSANEPSPDGPSASTGVLLLPPDVMELKELIGIDFKADIVREFHPLVINSLFDDLKHQCDICGLRFKLQEQLYSHSDFHAAEKSEFNNSAEESRKWFSNVSNWVSGNMELPQVPDLGDFLEEVVSVDERGEPMVPADESQSICALCGEPFEDFYSHEREEWMYKGTMYLDASEQEQKWDMGSMDASEVQGLIVHAKCMSSSADAPNDDKMDWTDG